MGLVAPELELELVWTVLELVPMEAMARRLLVLAVELELEPELELELGWTIRRQQQHCRPFCTASTIRSASRT